ncbi:BZ3500_MvSof-1268-A1-R1_Chr7-3g09662 [Microbotryum saponariae]|uniref:BZ3500_MvSof-1268-A1-R1_Chr7-3g09662 protein n=1 Tax=Microbotryum saponariae TaxID=289078 RepID=A0A2X0KVF4_9BASI|nr:BZ3501_MvSof-1269-A2-R1_Chr7-2g09385 [Microbotryum saponariae]SDA02369.1 BZ3500_MvSof-1268-A1-R1_Chr7-3g09662 [Microbotryum saponariae]
MRHRLGYNHLSRPTAHRMSMLRNLVSSLLEHEQITTTLAKAKATQRMAERVIELGKKGGPNEWNRANAFLWASRTNAPTTLRPLFTSLAERYASRPGGYTRLIRSGHRVGDHAPLAILELVDNRNDLKFETASKALARELALRAKGQGERNGPDVWWGLRTRLEAFGEEGIFGQFEKEPTIESMTKKNVLKALRYRKAFPPSLNSDPTLTETPTTAALHPAVQFLNRTHHHYLHHLASLQLSTPSTPSSYKTIKQLTQRLRPSESRGAPRPVLTVPMMGRRVAAGQSTRGWPKHDEQRSSPSSLDGLEQRLSGLDLNSGEAKGREKGGPISRAKAGRSRDARSATRASSTTARTEAGL